MSPDTAEFAIARHPSESAHPAGALAPHARGAGVDQGVDQAVPPHARGAAGQTVPPHARRADANQTVLPRARGGGPWGALTPSQADRERAVALRAAWRALWSSRLLVWIAGSGAVTFGFGPVRHAFNPAGFTRGFGWLGDVLAAPAARWDAAWYLVIAHYGYRPDLGAFTASRTAFFPLYPLGIRGLSDVGLAPVVAGVVLSMLAFLAGLYGLHRLSTLEVARLRGHASLKALAGLGPLEREDRLAALDGADAARLVLLLTAFAPMAFYFSAVYSESLYLALSVGVFLCARRGRWARAAMLGALASATRSTGVVLILPLLLLYLYGPREDRDPDRARGERDLDRGRSEGYLPGRVLGALSAASQTLRPRYRLRRDVLWLLFVPLGLVLYMGHLALAGGDPLAPFHAEAVWSRHFAGPYGGIWDGAKAAVGGLRQLLSFQRQHLYYPAAGGDAVIAAGHNLLLFAFLLLAIPAVIGVLRLLPAAYGLYSLAALALPLSYPVAPQPLMSLPRFLVVLFPLNMWLAVVLSSRPRVLTRLVLVLSGLAMAFFGAEFSTWHWVA